MSAKLDIPLDFFLDRTIRDVACNLLKKGKDNPRVDLRTTDPERFAALRESLKLGFFEPLLVEGPTQEVIAGHQRLEACLDLQRKTVPVLFLRKLTPEEKVRVRIAANHHSGYDSLPLLREQVAALPKDDIPLLALDQITLGNLDLLPMDTNAGENTSQEPDAFTTFKIPRMPSAAAERIYSVLEDVMKAQQCKKAAALSYIVELFAQDPELYAPSA